VHLCQRCCTHIQEHAIEDGHWNELQDGCHKDGQTNQREDDQVSDALLSKIFNTYLVNRTFGEIIN
jgi:hypothetical protein